MREKNDVLVHIQTHTDTKGADLNYGASVVYAHGIIGLCVFNV